MGMVGGQILALTDLNRQTGVFSENSTVKSSPIGFSVVNPSLFKVNTPVEGVERKKIFSCT